MAGALWGCFSGLGLPAERRVGAMLAAAPAAFGFGGAGRGADVQGLRQLLETAAGGGVLGEGLLPEFEEAGAAVDVEASLWFIRAGQVYAGAAPAEETFLRGRLWPRAKRILQAVIAQEAGASAVRMDDGGLLVGEGETLLRLNALWHSALETVAARLKEMGDRGGDHYERLAARFRRSFAKAYWCEEHGCICPPWRRSEADPTHGRIPAADQLLLAILPSSPIPKTKQRQMALRVRGHGLGRMGVLVEDAGVVKESLLHRVWLGRALAATAEQPGAGREEEAEALLPLRAAAGGGAVHALYHDGAALGEADLLATAEVRGALRPG